MSKYTLTEIIGEPKFIVTITADMNDGDYLTNVNEYTGAQFEHGLSDELFELSKIVGKHYKLPEFEEKGFANIPFDGQSGESCHTLEELTIQYRSANGKMYKVELTGE